MDIKIHQTGLIHDFLKGNLVFKITSKHPREVREQEVGMVTTKEDYERKLMTHQYLPILHILSFYKQMAYLYGCLNLEFKKPRNKVFTFWFRYIRTKDWYPWFVIYPYEELLFIDFEEDSSKLSSSEAEEIFSRSSDSSRSSVST